MSIVSVMPSNHLILCCPLLLLPSIFPSIRVFSNESALRMRWPKYWGFSFNISPSNEHPRLISFRMDWLDLHAVQGALKSLLQHHSPKASVLRHSAFFIVQLSHPYMPARYDLNQIPYEFTVEIKKRFKGLDLVNSVPEELWTEVHNSYRRWWTKPSWSKRKARRKSGYLKGLYK